MGPGETAGIVVVTVAFVQGLIAFSKFVINKFTDKEEVKVQEEEAEEFDRLEQSATLFDEEAAIVVPHNYQGS